MNIDCISNSREIYYVYRYQPLDISIAEKMHGNYRSYAEAFRSCKIIEQRRFK